MPMIIGLDVGGTHTDVVLLGENGLEKQVKVPTDTAALFNTVLTGLEKITENVPADEITHAVLSTTLTTNAIVQGKLSPAGMIVTSGPGIHPEAFRTDENYFIVPGGIDHSGREIEKIDPDKVKAAADQLERSGIRHVGVVGKFSARNPVHERQIAEILGDRFDRVFLGHRISGNFGFPRRIDTTFLNASIYPVHRNFFEAVSHSLKQKGIQVPIHILKADGGTMGFESSIAFPGQSILSGPAASVMGSVAFAPDYTETLILDIGGTSTDMAVLIKGVPLLAPHGVDINQYKTLIRALKTQSIGIGGDSCVRVIDGELKIGPDRTGKAMGYGGSDPTPTDALFVLERSVGGDRGRAIQGIEPIAAQLGLSMEEAAFEIFDKTCREILAGARQMIADINSKPVYTVKEALQGYQVNPDHILVLGGPAAYFAEHFENISSYTVDTVPECQVANAIGTALSRTTCEITLFVDTQKGLATAPEESFSQTVDLHFSRVDAHRMAADLLKQKAVKLGAQTQDIETELLEDLEFNIVRGFRMMGKNLRVKQQIKPGLIHDFKTISKKIADSCVR
ncbi:MAG: hydantoinase/oxoprolinase family protein [Desulfobacterales bacterium]|nr:hydantoinase/oxoprolinase family protein [Desulfobacterales bacterium]